MSEHKINMLPSGGVQEQIDNLKTMAVGAGESLSFNVLTTGFVTGGQKEIYFLLPINRIITASKVSITNIYSISFRQNNRYLFGTSAGSSNIDNSTISLLITTSGISIKFTFSNADTNAINNNPIGVDIHGKISFS